MRDVVNRGEFLSARRGSNEGAQRLYRGSDSISRIVTTSWSSAPIRPLWPPAPMHGNRLPRCGSVPAAVLLVVVCACAPPSTAVFPTGSTAMGAFDEQVRVLDLYPGVTATLVAPRRLDLGRRVDLILYALPNGNTTAETIGGRPGAGVGWRYDIQHIGAQTRALGPGPGSVCRGVPRGGTRSWPEWRRRQGYDRANRRIVELVDQIRVGWASGHQRASPSPRTAAGVFHLGIHRRPETLPDGWSGSRFSMPTTASSRAMAIGSSSGSTPTLLARC